MKFAMNLGSSERCSLLVVGGKGLTHVGQAFHTAALSMGIQSHQLDTADAYRGPRLLRAAIWRLLSRRPMRLTEFSKAIEAYCAQHRPNVMLCTGNTPIRAETLARLRELGVLSVNFSTDDPLSKNHFARHFTASLPLFDWVFTPRRANQAELAARCKKVSYLPFGFDPVHCEGPEPDAADLARLHSQVLIVGGGDRDRIPIARAVLHAGYQLALYGGYWERDNALKPVLRGLASPEVLRRATRAADIVLCLVRRANRDGHVMRSFEAGATGACLLVEDTQEHRAIFGPDDVNVAYFQDHASMLHQIKRLLAQPEERERMKRAVQAHIQAGKHTYRDRLSAILREVTGTTMA